MKLCISYSSDEPKSSMGLQVKRHITNSMYALRAQNPVQCSRDIGDELGTKVINTAI
jgi:hypothetical protein